MASRSFHFIYANLTTHKGDAQQKANFKFEEELKCSVLSSLFSILQTNFSLISIAIELNDSKYPTLISALFPMKNGDLLSEINFLQYLLCKD